MTLKRILMKKHGVDVEVPMSKDDATYRDVLSPAEIGMVVNGGYILVDDKEQGIDIDSALPSTGDGADAKTDPPIIHLRPLDLPRIWIDNYIKEDKERPLFYFLGRHAETAEKLEAAMECLGAGGFAAAHFTDRDELRSVLDDKELLDFYNPIGLVADPETIKSIFDIRQWLINERGVNGETIPFACACQQGSWTVTEESALRDEKGDRLVPATVDLALDVELFCDEMINTLYVDERSYLPETAKRAEARDNGAELLLDDEVLIRASECEDDDFYARLGTSNTNFLRDLARMFRRTGGRPGRQSLCRLVNENRYIGQSRLASCLDNEMLVRFFKKILDWGRWRVCFGGIR